MTNLTESNRIEFKRELNDKLEREIVAFLNYQEGGALYLGIDDNGVAVGVSEIDSTQLKVIDRIKNNILPSTLGLFDVIIETIAGKEVVKILVSSGTEKPYYLKQFGMAPAGCFLRVGSGAQPMTTEMIDAFHSKRTRNSLGRIAAPRQELTFEQLKIFYEAKGFELNQQFAQNLELLTENKKYNYAAYLLADENGVSIKVAKYLGKDKVDLIENAEYGYCSLIKATKNVLDKLNIENITQTKITSKERKEKRLVDPIALREALVNAIVHNDYSTEVPPVVEIFSDRIMITSAGGLPQSLTKEEFFSGISAPRNKELMRIFKDVQLVEQLGSGMQRILKNYDSSIFDISPNFLRVTFFYDKNILAPNVSINVSINETEKRAITAIEENPNITIKALSASLGISERQISRIIKTLSDTGYISRTGSRKTGVWTVNCNII